MEKKAKGANHPMDESRSHPMDDQADETWEDSTDDTWDESTDDAWENTTDDTWEEPKAETWDESTDEAWDESTDDAWDESTDDAWDESTGEDGAGAIASPPKSPAREPADRPRRPRSRGRTLLWLAGIAVAALLVGRYVVQGIGGPGARGTGAGQASRAPTSQLTPNPGVTPVVPKSKSTVGLAGPIILMNPGIVKPTGSITVNGYGFDPLTTADLVLKQGQGAGRTIGYVRIDQTGSFYTSFPLPQGLIAGPFTVEARQRSSAKLADASGSVSAGAAFVKMSAMVGKVGDLVGWSGSGFAPGETVNVYWNAIGGQPLATFHADGGGNVRASVQVPFAALGDNSFIFMGSTSQAPVTAQFLVLKLYPQVKPSTYALQANNPISFSGAGFGPYERVLIFLNNTNGPPMATAQADAKGAFKNAGTMVIPFTFKGKQTIVFVGEQSRAPTAIGFTVLPYSPHAQASTYGGLPGTTISFYAFDFAKNEVVHVYVGGGMGGGGNMVACFRTDGKGAAGAAGSYTIPGSAQGKLSFRLVGSDSGATTTAVVSVMPSIVPVQVPPSPPFTCPLDQPNQQPNQTQPQPPTGGAPNTQAPQQPQQAPAGGAVPGGQTPQQPATAPAGGGTSGAGQAPQQQLPAQNNTPGTAAPGDQNPPQAPAGAGPAPSDQAPQAPQPSPSSSTGAPQARLARPAQAASLLLFAAVVSTNLVATSRTANGEPPAASSRRAGPLGRSTGPANRAGDQSNPSWVAGLGLLWLVAVVALAVFACVKARIARRAMADGLRTAGTAGAAGADGGRRLSGIAQRPAHVSPAAAQTGAMRVDSTGGARANLAPAVQGSGLRTDHSTSSSLQRLPVVLTTGELGLVPQVAGVIGLGGTTRAQDNSERALMLIGATRLDGLSQPFGLLAIADGMGRTPSGREASMLTMHVIVDHVVSRLATDASEGMISLTSMLAEALRQANSKLYQQNVREHTTAGTTAAAALLIGNVAHIVNVGDSRAYLYSPLRGLRQVTTDHSIVAALVATRLLPPDAVYTHPRRGQIYRCLGRQEDTRIDTYEVNLESEDRIILCSDGLWGMVRDPEIEAVLRAFPDPHQASEQLVAAANRNGARDSASVIVARTLHDYEFGKTSTHQTVRYANEQADGTRGMVSPGYPPDRG